MNKLKLWGQIPHMTMYDYHDDMAVILLFRYIAIKLFITILLGVSNQPFYIQLRQTQIVCDFTNKEREKVGGFFLVKKSLKRIYN